MDVAESAGKIIDEMQPRIQRTADLVVEISASSKQQRDGAEQINTGIQQMSQVSQQSASYAEELAATAEELSGQADSLIENLSFFTVDQDRSSLRAQKKMQQEMAARQDQEDSVSPGSDSESAQKTASRAPRINEKDYEKF